MKTACIYFFKNVQGLTEGNLIPIITMVEYRFNKCVNSIIGIKILQDQEQMRLYMQY